MQVHSYDDDAKLMADIYEYYSDAEKRMYGRNIILEILGKVPIEVVKDGNGIRWNIR